MNNEFLFLRDKSDLIYVSSIDYDYMMFLLSLKYYPTCYLRLK